MKTENREVYISDDGKVFDTVEACQTYEREEAAKAKRIAGLQVWSVSSSFDSTEGRGYGHVTYIVTDTGFPEILQYCLDRFGQPLSAAMTSGTDGWGEWGSASEHQRYAEPISSRRRCHCGCKARVTHNGMTNGVTLMSGCELSVRRWVRDPSSAIRALSDSSPTLLQEQKDNAGKEEG